jgi:1-acyl-sn-glycerol-3-phosphate acyltransferase
MGHVDVLDRPECHRLLGAGGVGRISVTDGGTPVIRPVNFALDGDRIVFRTGESALWRASQESAPAEFEIDATDNGDHTAWSVIASGRLGEVPVGERPDRVPLQPWMPGDRQRFVALGIDDVSGRRITPVARRPPSDPPESGDPDAWGRSASARRATSRFVEPLYRWWFRVTWRGLDNIPRRGGALLVANHAGAVPVDAMLVMHGIEAELGRAVYGLHHHGLREVPYLGTLLERNGGVVAHPDNAVRLLRDEQQLVLVFPEGTKGTTKHYRDRYRLARFGRGGFIESAMRAGVPVVPVAITGTEEAMPSPVRIPLGAEVGLPVPLNVLLFGPLGALLPFPAKVEANVLDPVVFGQPAGLDRYRASDVAAAAEDVRARLQAALVSRVARRSGER